MAMEKRKWLLLVSIIAVVGFVTTVYISIFETSETFESGESIVREPLPSFVPFMVNRIRIPIYTLPLSSLLLIVAVISMSYYFISKRLEEKLERNFNIISKLVKKNHSVSNTPRKREEKNIILKFLNMGERKVVETLLAKKGEILQSEISRMDGMTKLKTHRAVRDLERKGVIKRESHGKTHRIILSKDIREAILK
jgi:DNA-binding MarR family transcriptional regulator